MKNLTKSTTLVAASIFAALFSCGAAQSREILAYSGNDSGGGNYITSGETSCATGLMFNGVNGSGESISGCILSIDKEADMAYVSVWGGQVVDIDLGLYKFLESSFDYKKI